MTPITSTTGVAPPVHVLLPAAILEHSPSLQDGVTADIERAHRFFGCELIQEAGVLLRLPQVVMATAQTMLQRFFYRKSLRDFDAFRVAFSCLFLAAKVEERHKRIRDVLSVFYALYRRRKWAKTSAKQQLLDLEGATYCLWRDWLVLVERQILIDLGFSLYNVTEHPHKYILYYIKIIGGSKELAQKAWGYVNDSLRIDLCVRYESEVIACAAIFLASRFLQIKLPDDPHWYALFDVDRRELHEASIAIMELYHREKVCWLEPLTEVNPFAADDNSRGSHDTEGDEEEESGNVAAVEAKAVAEQAPASPVGPEGVGGLEAAQPTAVAAQAPVQPQVALQSPVETERTVLKERTIASDDDREVRAPQKVAAETAIVAPEAGAFATAVRTATAGTVLEAAVARPTNDETAKEAAEDPAVEARAVINIQLTITLDRHIHFNLTSFAFCKKNRRKNRRRMAFLLDEEAAYEDELIDEFDAPDALLNVTPALSHVQQRQPPPPPLVSAQSLRHQPTLPQVPVAAVDPWETARLAGALYPSFEELTGGGDSQLSGNGTHLSIPSSPSPYNTPVAPPSQPAPQHQREVQYPSAEPSAIQTEPRGRNMSRNQGYSATPRSGQNSGNIVTKQQPVVQSTLHHAETPAERSVSFRSPPDPVVVRQQELAPVEKTESLPMLSQHEFEVKQKEIAQELKGYEQQLDYLAHALAGDTLHQKGERKRRELERQEREHQRLVAMENRVQHQIERAHDRELRRAKVLEKAHCASRSSSPEMRREEESRDDNDEEPENVDPHKDS